MPSSFKPNNSSETGTQAAVGKVWSPKNSDLRQLFTILLVPISSPIKSPITAATANPITMRTSVALILGQSSPSVPSSANRRATWSGDGNKYSGIAPNV